MDDLHKHRPRTGLHLRNPILVTRAPSLLWAENLLICTPSNLNLLSLRDESVEWGALYGLYGHQVDTTVVFLLILPVNK